MRRVEDGSWVAEVAQLASCSSAAGGASLTAPRLSSVGRSEDQRISQVRDRKRSSPRSTIRSTICISTLPLPPSSVTSAW